MILKCEYEKENVMKETKSVSEYSVCNKGSMDGLGQWFYGLLGWRWVKTTSMEDQYVEKKTYLVADRSDGLRVEDRYESTRVGYEVSHTLERETDDPKYEKYCELERRVGSYSIWGDNYPTMLRRLKSEFSKGVPQPYTKYKNRFKKFYVIGAILLSLLAFFAVMGPEKLSAPEDYSFPAAIALFGCSSAVCIICGIVGHMKSLNKKKINEAYRAYLAECFSGRSNSGLGAIVKEALELQMEP